MAEIFLMNPTRLVMVRDMVFYLPYVKVMAAPLAGASVELGVEVVTT